MKFNTTEFKNNQLIIKGRKSPFVIRATLTVVLLICILIPIIVAASLMSERKGPHIGLFLGFFFLWGIGFYLLRIILWNTYGREVLTFESDKIIYEADYGFFKDGKAIISTTNIELTAMASANEKIPLGVFELSNEEKQITTVLKLPFEELTKIKSEIEGRYI